MTQDGYVILLILVLVLTVIIVKITWLPAKIAYKKKEELKAAEEELKQQSKNVSSSIIDEYGHLYDECEPFKVLICQKCGNATINDDYFCGKCGQKLK